MAKHPPEPTHVLQAVHRLVGDLFGPGWLEASCTVVSADELPPPFASLLNHTDHMTTVLQTHHGGPVTLRVLADRLDETYYRRAVVLNRSNDDRVVEFGVVRIQLDQLEAQVRDEILARRAPLGDILIRHQVLRRVEPRAFVKVVHPSAMLAYFREAEVKEAFGRWGTIHTNGSPAIELLEVLPD